MNGTNSTGHSGPQAAPEDRLDIASVVAPAPGGTLAAFVEHLQGKGRPAVLSPDGREAWVPGVKGEMMRFPLASTDPPDLGLVRRVLRLGGIWTASYFLQPSEGHIANCFHYVARDPAYSLQSLSANTRSKIRRGLKNFNVRLSTWDELVDKGFPSMVDTWERHRYTPPKADALAEHAELRRDCPFYQLWGAWSGQELAAWVEWVRVDDWALIGLACSLTSSLRAYPNNALIFAATRHFLADQKCSYVSYGISSVQAHAETLVSLHTFKLQMGYEALAMHRHFVPAPILRPMLCWRSSSWLLEKAAALVPQIAAVRKVAGMSRLLSGREKDPLAWAKAVE